MTGGYGHHQAAMIGSPQGGDPAPRRLAVLFALVAAVIALTIAAAVVSLARHRSRGPGASPSPSAPGKALEHTSVERQIESFGYREVVCNGGADLPLFVRARYRCSTAEGVLVEVTVVNAAGEYIWTPAN